jgi:haloacetate dehalogenase
VFEGFAEHRVDVDGATIACQSGGAGPPVLLLHGFPQCRALWAGVAPLLAERYTVVCADLRGYGDSSKPRQDANIANYSFRALAADQVQLMRALGHPRFHLVGHDRGARTALRLALDHPDAVASLALLDIVPTRTLFLEANRATAATYWHWYFLSLPEPFPERLIGADPDYFYETCLTGWGSARLADFDPAALEAYRRAWRDPGMIHGSCADYRAAATIDLEHDAADLARCVDCPALVLYGAQGAMARLFDIPAQWRGRLPRMQSAALPGGHFFIDQHPALTARALRQFLDARPAPGGPMQVATP